MHDSYGEVLEQQTMINAVKIQSHKDEQSGETKPAEHTFGTLAETSAPTRLSNETTMPKTSTKKRVLIVDDELFILEIMDIMLTRMGYCVDSTASSENALAMLDKAAEPYDLILADLTMPEMTGPQLAMHVRRRYPGIPMILITGLDVDGPDQPDQTTLFDAVLTKPVSFANLETAVRRILA
jgi:CheY-like chemotaxis protein